MEDEEIDIDLDAPETEEAAIKIQVWTESLLNPEFLILILGRL